MRPRRSANQSGRGATIWVVGTRGKRRRCAGQLDQICRLEDTVQSDPNQSTVATLIEELEILGEASANEGLNFKKIKYRFEVEAHFAIQ